MHRAYARKAKVIVPALETYEKGKGAQNVIALPTVSEEKSNAKSEPLAIRANSGF